MKIDHDNQTFGGSYIVYDDSGIEVAHLQYHLGYVISDDGRVTLKEAFVKEEYARQGLATQMINNFFSDFSNELKHRPVYADAMPTAAYGPTREQWTDSLIRMGIRVDNAPERDLEADFYRRKRLGVFSFRDLFCRRNFGRD